MGDNDKPEKNETKVLTVRIPIHLMERLDQIANETKLNKSEIAKRYLSLSEIFTLNDNYQKIDSDNQILHLYPEKLINEVFNLISKIPGKEQFRTRLELGDKLGDYINNITYNMGIKRDDYREIFKLIETLGWFKLGYRKTDTGDSSIILIPKSFGEKSLVYAMVYRIITRKKHPDNWTEKLLNYDIPHKQEKLNRGERDENEVFKQDYKILIQDNLEPDLEQEKLDHYYFRRLRVKI